MMKTALVSPCFLEGEDGLRTNRLQRNIRFIDYYRKIKKELGIDKIVLFDNCSDYDLLKKLNPFLVRECKIKSFFSSYFHQVENDLIVIRFDEYVERSPVPHGYGYCWRALWAYGYLMDMGFQKIIATDSDSFVLSKRMAKFIRECNSGWVSFWNERYRFPDSSIQIINWDNYFIFREYTKHHWASKIGVLMERDIPYTTVNRDFKIERYGEVFDETEKRYKRTADTTLPNIDWYGQMSLDVEPIFGKYEE